MDWGDDWQKTATYPNATFADLMNQVGWLSCKDPRDHIYAFLAHPLAQVGDDAGAIVKPDYSKAALDVYLELAKKLLPTEGMRLLYSVQHNGRTIMEDYPSWIPWCRGIEYVSCTFGIYTGFYYNASASGPKALPLLLERDHLDTQGVIVDIVNKTYKFSGPDFGYAGNAATSSTEIQRQRLLKLAWMVMQASHTTCAYPADKRLDAFSLTLCAGLFTYQCAEDHLQEHRSDFAAYWKLLSSDVSADPTLNEPQPPLIDDSAGERFFLDMKNACNGRSFLFTEKGRYGLGPCIAQPGDLCCVIFGAKVPFLLRRTETEGHYKLVGEVYLHGIMRGEAIDRRRDPTLRSHDFIIC